MNPDEWEHRLPIPNLRKSQSGVAIIMSSLGIDSAIRIGNPSATIKWGLTGLQFSSPNHPMNSNKPIGQNVRIGHVHLKVADLERALGFYCGILGFETTVRFGHSHSLRTCGRRWRCLANWVVS
jgi:hypothetical protein